MTSKIQTNSNNQRYRKVSKYENFYSPEYTVA